ncbi:hypothetical protein EJ06DRAFT_535195 [Trichodelitschia bisporula]|uniref:Vacuolar protein sorting-associated protein 51 homolog n=1 Tax=Trichodelitschia bisporula TaxID=703511 RepID=A0A6G1IA91_9PEZI|nr:hypothetical protein EJ06DRAFT_535195 [Trichodelitschia bisporula]
MSSTVGRASPSPRPSLSIRSPSVASSSRNSLEIPASATSARVPRRSRIALRDYYGLKSEDAASEAVPAARLGELEQHQQAQQQQDSGALGVLDGPSFDAGAFVRGLVEREGLGGLLGVERELVGEIRGLDGERKALVYDNYSKLIKATETIRKMRSSMDPLTPATSTLAPAIAHIAETAAVLATELAANVPAPRDAAAERRDEQRKGVQWVLAAPRRLQSLISAGRRDEAKRECDLVRGILDRWADAQVDVDQVRQLKRECEEVLAS